MDVHDLALKTNGTLWAWGYNANGQLGFSPATYGYRVFSPVQVGAATDWTKVFAGTSRSMGLRGTGTLYSWSNHNNYGQLGDGTNATAGKSSPIQIGVATNWTQIHAAENHSLGIRSDGTLWSWGSNNEGQLGLFNGSPVQIGSATDWAEITLGQDNVFAVGVKTGGSIWSWGLNNLGQLGLNDTATRTSPVQIGALTDWSKVSSGRQYTIAIKTDGSLWSWGEGADGKLASGSTANRSSPVQVGVFKGWTKVSAGAASAIAKK